MTKVKFFKSENIFTKLEVSGHSGYADYGYDIVCAAVSSVVQSFGLGIVKVLGINAKIKQNDESGYYLVELPNNLNEKQTNESQILFDTLFETIKNLSASYSKFIKLEVK